MPLSSITSISAPLVRNVIKKPLHLWVLQQHKLIPCILPNLNFLKSRAAHRHAPCLKDFIYHYPELPKGAFVNTEQT